MKVFKEIHSQMENKTGRFIAQFVNINKKTETFDIT
jgi:hypothetical protein